MRLHLSLLSLAMILATGCGEQERRHQSRLNGGSSDLLAATSSDVDSTKDLLAAAQANIDSLKAALAAEKLANSSVVSSSLVYFSGLWLAEKKSLPNIDKDCRLFLRVSTKPNLITRALACSGGRVEILSSVVDHLALTPGDYDGGMAVLPMGPKTASSCGPSQTSLTANLDNLYFNTATHSGAAAATSAHTTFAGQSLDFIYGSADDDLKGTSCENIGDESVIADGTAARSVKIAAGAANTDDYAALSAMARDAASRAEVLKLGASACKATATNSGCFTAAGFQATSSN